MVRIAKLLLGYGKVVIFATTTPVSNDNPHDKNERIKEYNAHIVPVLKNMGILINDLHSLVYPNIDEYISADKIHLTEVGAKACADQVVKAIREAEKLL